MTRRLLSRGAAAAWRLSTGALALACVLAAGHAAIAQDSAAAVGYHASGTAYDGPLGTVDVSTDAGASGSVNVDASGVEMEGQLGIQVEVDAQSETVAVGDENLGASANVDAQVEAMLGAAGSIGAHIDENGITIGAEASAGAYVSAEVGANFEAHVFGVQTNVRVYAEGYAGALAEGEARVTIGYDGTIEFALGASLAVGLGLGVGMEFSIDASDLMEELGIPSMEDLILWLDAFVQDPAGVIAQLALDAAVAVGDALVQEAAAAVDTVVDAAGQALTDIANGIGGLFSGPAAPAAAPAPAPEPEPAAPVSVAEIPLDDDAGADAHEPVRLVDPKPVTGSMGVR